MRIDIITLFPELFEGLKTHSIVGRAIGNGKIELATHNLRDWAGDKYKSVDDHPYGGGPGMVLRFDVLFNALRDVKSILKSQISNSQIKTILLTPQGQVYKQKMAQDLAKETNLILICGHYEGFDHRVHEHLVDEIISIGDYILTGGEIPAMVVIDAVVRLLPGVLEKEEATSLESFSEKLLEYPQYTRPEEYKGWKVPKVLLSGNHKEIEKWRKEMALEKTKKVRPDLL